MISFKRKSFSNYIGSDALKGATIGATIGSIATGGFGAPTSIKIPDGAPKYVRKGLEGYNSLVGETTIERTDKDGKVIGTKKKSAPSGLQNLIVVGAATLIGASLGALVGAVKEIDKKISRTTINNRLLTDVTKKLLGSGFKEDLDFTVNPATATNLMRTRVCIAVTKDAAYLRVLVNTVSDKKLKMAADRILKGLKGNFQIRCTQATNKFNDINITTVSNASSNVNTVFEIASGFIKAGYPVYLVEVG